MIGGSDKGTGAPVLLYLSNSVYWSVIGRFGFASSPKNHHKCKTKPNQFEVVEPSSNLRVAWQMSLPWSLKILQEYFPKSSWSTPRMLSLRSPAVSLSMRILFDGKIFSSLWYHSTSGSGIPVAQAVNFAVIPLYSSVSPIRFRKVGGSIFCWTLLGK